MSEQSIITAEYDYSSTIAFEDFSPFCLLRVASLPFSALERLSIPDIEGRLTRVLDAESNLESLRDELVGPLHKLVSEIDSDDYEFRRAVLKLRRDIHNCRPTTLEASVLDKVVKRVNSETIGSLKAWIEAQGIIQSMELYETELLRELQENVRPALREPIQVAEFRQALAFASSGVARECLSEECLPKAKQPSNLERSLLGYLNRAAAKTSPFSSFMALSVVPIDLHQEHEYPVGVDVEYVSRININRGLISRFHDVSLPLAANAGDFKLSVNPTLKERVSGHVQALCYREVVLLGRPWLEQRLAFFRFGRRIAEVLASGIEPVTYGGWREKFLRAGVTLEQVDTLLAKLIERDVLQAPPLFDAFESSPIDVLFRRWENSNAGQLKRGCSLLGKMKDKVEKIEDADIKERVHLLSEVRDLECEIVEQVSSDDKTRQPLQNVVLEDCWVNGISGKLGRQLATPLIDLQYFLSRQVVVSPYYDRMRQRFLEDFGEDGRCDDIVSFLVNVSDKLIDIPEFGASYSAPDPVPADPGVRLPVTAQVQVAAGSDDCSMLAINRVFDGAGWLATRFTPGNLEAQGLLREKLRSWLSHVHGLTEPVDVVLSGQCNDLQSHAQVTDRVLRWPGEPLNLPSRKIIDAQDLHMTYNRKSGLLELFDSGGKQISLVYLGATFPSPIWGVRYALSILTQPYLLSRPDFRPPALTDYNGIEFEPRLTEGSLVLKRATWWISSRYLRATWFKGKEFEKLLNVKRDRNHYGIPRYVFGQRYIAPERTGLIPSDVLEASRKPIWIDLANPFWLNMLKRIAEKSEWISLTEPFPGHDELWLNINGQHHVSEMQLEMVVTAQ